MQMVCHFLKKHFFKAVFGSQHWAQSTKRFHIFPVPTHAQSPQLSTSFTQSDTFVTIDEPTLAHHYHQFTIGFTFGVVHESLDKCE